MGKPQNRKKSNKINMNNNISKMMKLMLKIRRRNHKKIIKNSMNKNLQKNPKGKKKFKILK